MYIDIVPNRNSPPAVLLRRAWREDGKIKKETVANLSSLPMEQIQQFRRILKGETLVSTEDAFQIIRAHPHGHVAAVVGTMHRLGIPELLSTRRHRKRQLALAMIAARILEPCSKLATAQRLSADTLSSSLGEAVGVGQADADDLYGALDWLVRGQARIERKLADRHLEDGQLVLWDVTRCPSRAAPLLWQPSGDPEAARRASDSFCSDLWPPKRVCRSPLKPSQATRGIRTRCRPLWTGSRSGSGLSER